MPEIHRIFNSEDNRNLYHGFPVNESELRERAARIRYDTLLAKKRFYYEVTLPKHIRVTRRFEVTNFLANMSHLGAAAGIWIHRLVS